MAELQILLAKEKEVVAEKAVVTNRMMEHVSREKAKTNEEAEKAAVEEEKVDGEAVVEEEVDEEEVDAAPLEVSKSPARMNKIPVMDINSWVNLGGIIQKKSYLNALQILNMLYVISLNVPFKNSML